MSTGSLSRRYAKALFGLGAEENNLDTLGKELGEFAAAMIESPELTETLSNPAFPRGDRRKVVQAILSKLGVCQTTTNTLMLLLDKDRVGILPDISRELARMIDDKAGRVKARVVSAQALSAEQANQLQAALEKLSGKKVELERSEDPSLLGGVVAHVGDMVYDSSLKTQLQQIRDGIAS